MKLTQDVFTIFNEIHLETVSQYRWRAHKDETTFYVRTNIYKKKTLYLHTLLTGIKEVDHIDGNGLNNLCGKLRNGSKINCLNKRPQRNKISGFKGITWDKARQKWLARIGINGKTKYLGVSTDPRVCARMYDAAMQQHSPQPVYL